MNTVNIPLDHYDLVLITADLIKGFAAKCSEKAVEELKAFKTLGEKYILNVEEDITFSTQDD